MKKVLSILLSVLMICGTISVLFSLPAAARTDEPANLIVNGDANGVGGKLVYDATDAANSTFEGEFEAGNAYGWTDNSEVIYADAKVAYPNTDTNVPSGYYGNFSGENVLWVNNWRQALQFVELEPGKTYRVSLKATVQVRELAAANSGGSFDIYLDAKKDCASGSSNGITSKPWYVKRTIEGTKVKDGNTNPFFGDGAFKDYSFTFSSDELASYYGIAKNANNKYDVRFVVSNNSSYCVLFDDVVLQETYDVPIAAGVGGTVDTASVPLGETATIRATAYYGNTFAGWYDKNDNLVSEQSIYTGVIDKPLTAKFNVYNLVANGDFENGDDTALAIRPNIVAGNGATMSVVSAPASENVGHGNKALYVNTTGDKTYNTMFYVVRVPFTVEKNKTYVFKYSIYGDGADAAIRNTFNKGPVTVAGAEWSPTATVSMFTYNIYPEQTDSTSHYGTAWKTHGGKNTTINKQINTNVCVANAKWVDVTVLFNAGEDASVFNAGSDTAEVFFTIGYGNDGVNDAAYVAGNDSSKNFYLDNISVTEAGTAAPSAAVSVVADNGGSVKANTVRKTLSPLKFWDTGITSSSSVTEGVGTANVAAYDTNHPMLDSANNPITDTFYSQIAVGTGNYTAVPAEGFAFTAWKDENGNVVSTNATESFYTPGTYTAVFEATMGVTDAGYTVDNGDGTTTAYPYYGNLFDGWYTTTHQVITREATIDNTQYPDAVARFFKHNQIVDGGFEGGKNSTVLQNNATTEILTDTDGNKFARLSNTVTGAKYTDFSWPFTVTKGKKYLVSFKVRDALDADGNYLSSSQMSYRSQIRERQANGNYVWAGLTFASQTNYRFGNIRNQINLNADLLPSGGALLNPGNGTADNFLKYVEKSSDWTTVSYILDATTLSSSSNGDLFASKSTAEVAMVLGTNAAGTMAMDIDDIVVDEIKDVYFADSIAANPATGGTYSVTLPASTVALPVSYVAYPAAGYVFDGWYNDAGIRVSMDEVYTPDTVQILTPKFKADALGFERVDGNEYTAVPYYGNKFDGWYDGDNLITTDATIDKSVLGDLKARFLKGGNLIFDGGFEQGASTGTAFDAYPDYHNGNTISVVETCVPQSGPEFGDYCLQIVPNNTQNSKWKGMINIPVDVKAGTTYLWKFSYTFTSGAHDPARDYATLAIDKANAAGAPTWSGNTIDFSMHVHKHSKTEPETNGWAWGRIGSAVYLSTNGTNLSATNEWIDIYAMFTPDTDGTYFLTVGTVPANLNTMVIDNMSLTAVETGKTPTTAVAGEGGSVSHYRIDEPAYWSTALRGDNSGTAEPYKGNIYANGGVDLDNPYYVDMYAAYYAVPDLGYTFDGWYQGITKISANKELVVKTTGDGEYTAKFKIDHDLYYATAEVDDSDVYGGYLVGDTAYNEQPNGAKVTFTAVCYNGNTFKGWYNKNTGKRVSTALTYTFGINENVELVAKFNCNNKFDDSGYENTESGQDIWGAGKEWDSASTVDAEASLSTAFVYNGDRSLNLYGPGAVFQHKAMALTANTQYHLGFQWLGSSSETKPTYVKIINAADGTTVAEKTDFEASADKLWQKAFINFNSGAVTSVIVEIKYDNTGASLYLDDLTLFDVATAPFSIDASVQVEGNIYPGYLTSNEHLEVYYNQNATVSVVGYEQNEFLGWFENGVKVSEDLDYTFPADSFTKLVARFKVNNIYPDSGLEYTEQGVSLSHGKYTYWSVSEQPYQDYGFDVTVAPGNADKPAYDGNAYYNVLHRNNTFSTVVDGLQPNTNYVFSFWWTMPQGGTFMSAIIEGQQNEAELARGMGGANVADPNGKYGKIWQQVVVPFNSQQNTSVKLSFYYDAGSGNMYMDNLAMYISDYVGVYGAGGGTVTSTVNGPAKNGTAVQAVATPDAGNTFKGWYNYKTSQLITTSTTYDFTVDGPTYVIAYFEGPTAEEFNYFVDGDFENYCFDGVIFSHPNFTTDWCQYSVVKKQGNITPKSGELFLTVGAQSRLSNIFVRNLKPNTDYTLSFWWAAEPGMTLGSFSVIRWLDESDDRLVQEIKEANFTSPVHVTSHLLEYGDRNFVDENTLNVFKPDQDSNGEWRRIEVTFNPGNRDTVFLHFNMSNPGGTGKVCFDDFRVTPGSNESYETIGNGDFQDAQNENGWEGNFQTATEGGNTYGVSTGSMSNPFKLRFEWGEPYTVSFKAKAPGGARLAYGVTTAGETSLFKANGINNAVTNTSYGITYLTSEWKEYSFDVSTISYESYRLYFESLGGGQFMIDDVKIEKADHRITVQNLTFEDDTDTDITIGSLKHAVHTNNKQFWRISDTVSHDGQSSLEMTKDNIDPNLNRKDENGNPDPETKDTFKYHALGQNWSNFRLLSGRRYNITFYAKAEVAGDKFQFAVSGTDDAWVYTDMINKTITLEDTEWQKISYDFTAINLLNNHGVADFWIDSEENNVNGSIFFDDITITETVSAATSVSDMLYVEDIAQNYFANPSFEKADNALASYIKSGDAYYGDKYVSVKAGDKIIIPVSTRYDFNCSNWFGDYIFAASLRGNASAKGFVGLAYSADGSNRMTFADGTPAAISVNTDSKWVRSGFQFTEYRWTPLYLVIECTEGSFDIDYTSMFNKLRGYKYNPQLVDATVEFQGYEDSAALNKGNVLTGTYTGLPSGSSVVLKGEKNYSSKIDAEGVYEIDNIAVGTYKMYVAPAGNEFMTLFGDITIDADGNMSGLACERLSGELMEVTGEGVRNGIAKITDFTTDWSFFTATNNESTGTLSAYIIVSDDYGLVGVTNVESVLEDANMSVADFVPSTGSAAGGSNQ